MPLRCPFLTWLITSRLETLKCSDLNQKGKFCLWQNYSGLTIMLHVCIFVVVRKNIQSYRKGQAQLKQTFIKIQIFFQYFAYLYCNFLHSKMLRWWAILITVEKSSKLKEHDVPCSIKLLILSEIFLRKPRKEWALVTRILKGIEVGVFI